MKLLGMKLGEENDPADTRMTSRNSQSRTVREGSCPRLRVREEVYLLAMGLCLLQLSLGTVSKAGELAFWTP